MSGLNFFVAGACAVLAIIDIGNGRWRWCDAPLGIVLTACNLLAGVLL